MYFSSVVASYVAFVQRLLVWMTGLCLGLAEPGRHLHGAPHNPHGTLQSRCKHAITIPLDIACDWTVNTLLICIYNNYYDRGQLGSRRYKSCYSLALDAFWLQFHSMYCELAQALGRTRCLATFCLLIYLYIYWSLVRHRTNHLNVRWATQECWMCFGSPLGYF